jgi:hypothetical protein
MLLILVFASRATRLCQQLRLSPTKPLRKDIFKDMVLKTDATEMCLFLVMAKSEGYKSFKV